MSDLRSKILVSGYYGFDNLGDEAILEELLSELNQLSSAENIYVLSAQPERTAKRYSVQSFERKNFLVLWQTLLTTKLFISGGGGLFQNTKSLGSIIFYGLQIILAKVAGAKVLIYAQGIGPLRGVLAKALCRLFFAQADTIALRDDASMSILQSWGISGQRTADPVWLLRPSDLPQTILDSLTAAVAQPLSERPFLALSLRESPDFSEEHLQILVDELAAQLPSELTVLLLPLQKEQDLPLLIKFAELWSLRKRKSHLLDSSLLERPSQWLTLFSCCRALVGMRLHALIMALKAGLPVAGIAYDPKVSQLLTDFEQPILILSKECDSQEWSKALRFLLYNMDMLAGKAQAKLELAKKMSCQNFELIAKILNMPS